ncbi:MAG: hydrogenase formation protein HypD [Pirellulaceae bacterium]|nr:hydrogenase formation protein HypD [Pirellulaceae bacterium]
MKYLDEFREAKRAKQLVEEIRKTVTRRWVLMDVCGGQTHSLLRHGIEEALEDYIELIHGPGCPVCVTPIEAIDLAQRLSMRPEVIVTSFGDMLRVPGSQDSLLGVRSRGGQIRSIYSPIDAIKLAQELPDREIVFLAVGFETTAPATALAVLQADRLGLKNFSLLVAHVRVLPAMEGLMLLPDNRVQGFLGAGHVCTITGLDAYKPFVKRFRVPVVVTGFEPIDLLYGIREAVRQLERGTSELVNCYSRSVQPAGNLSAMKAVDMVYRVVDMPWRGLGVIKEGGFALNDRFQYMDTQRRFVDAIELPIHVETRCRSADILTGRIKPTACSEFGKTCCPEQPLGAPMVSSEGACAAYFRYQTRILT